MGAFRRICGIIFQGDPYALEIEGMAKMSPSAPKSTLLPIPAVTTHALSEVVQANSYTKDIVGQSSGQEKEAGRREDSRPSVLC